jgi:RNA:NAD 2'-phosphotransferase (TPT1/KptA family)
VSKFLSLVLRHQPARIGLSLDGQGWADLDVLLARATEHGMAITAGRMWAAGHELYLAQNGVWLTQAVPAQFIELPEP